MVDVEQQIQQRREQFQRAREQIRLASSRVPQITQTMLRQQGVQPLSIRERTRGIQKQRQEVEGVRQSLLKAERDFETRVSSYLKEFRRRQELAKELGGYKNMAKLLVKDINKKQKAMITAYEAGDIVTAEKLQNEIDILQTRLSKVEQQARIASGEEDFPNKLTEEEQQAVLEAGLAETTTTTTYPRIRYIRDEKGKIIGVEDPFKGESRLPTAQDLLEAGAEQYLEKKGLPDTSRFLREQYGVRLVTEPIPKVDYSKLSAYEKSLYEQQQQAQRFSSFLNIEQIARRNQFVNVLTGGTTGRIVSRNILGATQETVGSTVGTFQRLGLSLGSAKRQITERPIETVISGINVAIPLGGQVLRYARFPKKITFLGFAGEELTVGVVEVVPRWKAGANRLLGVLGTPSRFKPTYYKFAGKELAKIEDVYFGLSGTQKIKGGAIDIEGVISREIARGKLGEISLSRTVGLTGKLGVKEKVKRSFIADILTGEKGFIVGGRSFVEKGKSLDILRFKGAIAKQDILEQPTNFIRLAGEQVAKKQLVKKVSQQLAELTTQLPEVTPTGFKPTPIKDVVTKETTVPKEWQGVYDVLAPVETTQMNLITNIQTSNLGLKPSVVLGISSGVSVIQGQLQKQEQRQRQDLKKLQKQQETQAQDYTLGLASALGLKSTQRQKQKQTITQRTTKRITQRTPTKPRLPPPFIPTIPTEEDEEKVEKKKPKVLVQGFNVFVKRKGKWVKVKEEALPKAKALELGAKVARTTLAASFKVLSTRKLVKPSIMTFTPSPTVFRSYKIRKGKRIPLADEFIQRRGKRLGTREEVFAIQRARTKYSFLGGKANGMGFR